MTTSGLFSEKEYKKFQTSIEKALKVAENNAAGDTYWTAKNNYMGGWNCFVVYRHWEGSVEGFRGDGKTSEAARQDALNQIGRKINYIRESSVWKGKTKIVPEFEFSNLCLLSSLNQNDQEMVHRDWLTDVRY